MTQCFHKLSNCQPIDIACAELVKQLVPTIQTAGARLLQMTHQLFPTALLIMPFKISCQLSVHAANTQTTFQRFIPFSIQWFQKLLAHFIFHSNTLHRGRFQAAKVLLARHSFGSRHLGGKGFGIRRKNGSLQRSRRS